MANILIVDDEANLRRLTARLLAPEHSVAEAGDGQAALRLLAAQPVQLLITDIYMPEMDGLELIAACRDLYPALPVIALSGGGGLQDLSSLRAADHLGALVTVRKPFSGEDLLTAVRQCLAAAEGD